MFLSLDLVSSTPSYFCPVMEETLSPQLRDILFEMFQTSVETELSDLVLALQLRREAFVVGTESSSDSDMSSEGEEEKWELRQMLLILKEVNL